MENSISVIEELDILRDQITELKKQNKEENWYSILAEAIQEGIWLIDTEGRTKFANRKMAEMFGYGVGEIIDLPLSILIGEDNQLVSALDTKQCCPEVVEHEVVRLFRKDGSNLWARLSASSIFDKDGQCAGKLISIIDITTCIEAEEELGRVNRTLKVLSEFNQALVRTADEKVLLENACQTVVEIGGYRLAFIGFLKNENKIIYPVAGFGEKEGCLNLRNILEGSLDEKSSFASIVIQTKKPFVMKNIPDNPDFLSRRAEALEKGYMSSIIVPLISDDRVFGVLKICAKEPDAFDSEEVKLLMTLGEDLSYGVMSLRTREKHKRAEEALAESEEKYRTMVEYSNDLIWTLDKNGNFTYANKRAEEVSGYKMANWLGKSFAPMIPLDDLPRIEDIFMKTLSGKSMQYEVTVYREDRSIFTLSVNTAPIFKNNEIVGTVSFGRDITESRKVEEALRASEREKALILESVSELVVYQDREHKVIWANSVAGESVNQMAEELVGRYCYEIWHQRTEPCINCPVTEALKTGKPQEGETSSPDGREWVINGYPVRGTDGEVISVVEVTQEITERKRMERELRESLEKLKRITEETICALATTVEIRDPYTAGHQQRVSKLACGIAREMGFSEEGIEGIYMAGLAHDIGKIHVPAEILSKPGVISKVEFDMIRTHPEIGYDILKTIEFSCPIAQMVLQHHERMDGSGYPAGLSGDEIILEARILAVADVVEAMSSYRPYRPSLGVEMALEEISQNRGILYDTDVVDACLKLFNEKGFKFD
ncbi:MAG: PAS domain S-box protein [Actinobacteria bacterium]|nr:PAS domain S-box protein [Actinomycetota bacterium]